MAQNDVVLLNGIIEQRLVEGLPSTERDEVFEYFSFEQLLKNYDLSREEFESGWTDGRGDGGRLIDAATALETGNSQLLFFGHDQFL